MRTDPLSQTRGRASDALRRLTLAGALAGAAALIGATGAGALSGKPVKAGEPLSSAQPAVAVDSSGTAYVAWANTKDVGGATNKVEYCVLPLGAKACSHAGTLQPADSAEYIDRVQVVVDGSTVVVLADVYGAHGEKSGEYEPEQEWQSTDGGATFVQPAGGASVADGIINADTAPLNAVIVPGTNVLGYGWNTAGGSPPTFDVFPLTSPPECSTESCPAGKYAELEPSSNPDQIGNAGGEFAAQQGSKPGVMGIFNTDFSNGPLGCSGSGTSSFGTAFAYGSGAQSAANNYNLPPGSAGSAWKVPITQADCDVEYPAVAGGPSGFGVIEDDLGTGQTVYHRFDEATDKFDTSKATVTTEGELDPALSQNASGDIYATFLGGGSGGPVSLAYSSDGGNEWAGPATLDATSEAGELTSSVNAAGKGWAVWVQNGAVYAQQFVAEDALTAPKVSESATSTSASVTVTITCSSTPCTVTVTITISGASMASVNATAAHAKKSKKPKSVSLGSGTFTIHGKGPQKLKVHLTKAGKSLLAKHHGRLSAMLLASEKVDGSTLRTTRTIKIKPGKAGKSKK
jgi:hypothetical protein